MHNALNWFEIPVTDKDRSLAFYNTIFGVEMAFQPSSPGFDMAMFPVESGIGGALMYGQAYTPSESGTLVYLNGGDDLSQILDKVEAAGGQVLLAKTDIGQHGFTALFRDSEGNTVGLHSMG